MRHADEASLVGVDPVGRGATSSAHLLPTDFSAAPRLRSEQCPRASSARAFRAILLAAWAALAPAVSCGGAERGVRPDDMSAEAHRAEAEREHALAEAYLKEAERAPEPSVRASPPFTMDDPGKTYIYPPSVYDPRAEHLEKAHRHRLHALQHERAAEELERFEAAECAGFPPQTRAACPVLGDVTRIVDVKEGVRIEFSDATRMDAVAAHMECHFAYARARGYPADPECPLYVKGVRLERVGPHAIVLVAPDERTARLIRVLARKHAIPARDTPSAL